MRIRQAVLVEPERIEIRDAELVPRTGYGIVEIAACGFCMTDLHKYLGEDPDYSLPMVLGHEPSGYFVSGEGRTRLKPGDRVTGAFEYAFATHALAPLDRLVRVPEGVPMEHALGEPLACIVNVARSATPELGDDVLVVGCGAMGLPVLGCLTRSCARRVIAADLRDERLAMARERGATHTFNPRRGDAWKGVMDLTDGKGCEIAVEFSGTGAGFDLASRLLRYNRGRLLVPSSHIERGEYNLWPLALDGAQVEFVHPAWSRDFDEDMRRGLAMLPQGIFGMERLLTHRFALEEAAAGFEAARAGAGRYLKAVLLPHGEAGLAGPVSLGSRA